MNPNRPDVVVTTEEANNDNFNVIIDKMGENAHRLSELSSRFEKVLLLLTGAQVIHSGEVCSDSQSPSIPPINDRLNSIRHSNEYTIGILTDIAEKLEAHI